MSFRYVLFLLISLPISILGMEQDMEIDAPCKITTVQQAVEFYEMNDDSMPGKITQTSLNRNAFECSRAFAPSIAPGCVQQFSMQQPTLLPMSAQPITSIGKQYVVHYNPQSNAINLHKYADNTDKKLCSLTEGYRTNVTALASSHGEQCIASASVLNMYAKPFYVIEIITPNGQLLHTLHHHEKPVIDLVWSPDNAYLISRSEDNAIAVWSMNDSNKPFLTYQGISQLMWLSKTCFLMITTHNKIHICQTNNVKHPLQIFDAYDLAAADPHDNYLIVASSHDTKIGIFNRNTKKIVKVELKQRIARINWSPDGNYLAVTLQNGLTKIWSMRYQDTDRYFASSIHHDTVPTYVGWFFSENYLLSCCDKTITLWDITQIDEVKAKTYSRHAQQIATVQVPDTVSQLTMISPTQCMCSTPSGAYYYDWSDILAN